MISMQGVPSSLILRNESWVRKQAHAFMRHMPSNVEKADLIQVGLIGVAQAAMSFIWEGDRESDEAKEAFVRYARMRVKGAMLDELRQMDHLGRAQRRKVKVIQVASERWRSSHGSEPTATELSEACGMSTNEIFELRLAARSGEVNNLATEDSESDELRSPAHEPATPQDEVEARVDTGIVMRRLEKFFATLPERERQVIDAYLGVGMTPIELAQSMKVSSSRVSQMFKSICERIGIHLGHQRSTDRPTTGAGSNIDDLIARREAELARSGRAWSELVEDVFAAPHDEADGADGAEERITVRSTTRWG
ncbi:MAG TPA: sigma-70 family RNA polymerase sigma factor [Burkholderiaceae bacterium]